MNEAFYTASRRLEFAYERYDEAFSFYDKLSTASVKPENRRDSGVPDVAYTYYAELLIAVGYKHSH